MKKEEKIHFFGMHFDFHATEQLENIGADADEEHMMNFLMKRYFALW